MGALPLPLDLRDEALPRLLLALHRDHLLLELGHLCVRLLEERGLLLALLLLLEVAVHVDVHLLLELRDGGPQLLHRALLQRQRVPGLVPVRVQRGERPLGVAQRDLRALQLARGHVALLLLPVEVVQLQALLGRHALQLEVELHLVRQHRGVLLVELLDPLAARRVLLLQVLDLRQQPVLRALQLRQLVVPHLRLLPERLRELLRLELLLLQVLPARLELGHRGHARLVALQRGRALLGRGPQPRLLFHHLPRQVLDVLPALRDLGLHRRRVVPLGVLQLLPLLVPLPLPVSRLPLQLLLPLAAHRRLGLGLLGVLAQRVQHAGVLLPAARGALEAQGLLLHLHLHPSRLLQQGLLAAHQLDHVPVELREAPPQLRRALLGELPLL